MDADEYAEVMYFSEHIEPIGYERFDVQTGIIAAAAANATRGRGRQAVAEDYMPIQKRRKKLAHEAMPVDDQVRNIFGGLMKRGKDHVKREEFQERPPEEYK